MRKEWICSIVLLCCLATSVLAAEKATDPFQMQAEAAGTGRVESALSSNARQLLDGVTISEEIDIAQAVQQIADRSAGAQTDSMRKALSALAKILVIAVLCGAAGSMQKKLAPILALAGALGVSAVLLGDMQGLTASVTDALNEVSVFSKTMLPVMAGAVTMAGAPSTAGIYQTATMFSFELLTQLVTNVLLPGVWLYLALSTLSAAGAGEALQPLAGFVKWLIAAVLKAVLTLFIAFLTISGSVGSGLDAMAIKAAKLTVSGAVPIVGGIISDATETMLSGAVLLKNAIGVFGMLGILAICIVPFCSAGISYLFFKGGVALLSLIDRGAVSALLKSWSEGFGLLLALLGTCCAILFLEMTFTVALVKGA